MALLLVLLVLTTIVLPVRTWNLHLDADHIILVMRTDANNWIRKAILNTAVPEISQSHRIGGSCEQQASRRNLTVERL
jgi:hypothetical protein